MTPQQFGKHVKKVAASPAAYEILDECRLDTFQTGGCFMLAEALHKLYALPLYAVRSDRTSLEHVVVSYGRGFIDSDGYQTEKKLIEKMQREAPNRRAWRVSPVSLVLIPWQPAASVKKLMALLQPRSNPQSEYGPAKRIHFSTELGELLEEQQAHSELVTAFISDSGDPLDDIATNFDLDGVSYAQRDAVGAELLEGTQASLIARGLPERFSVYRYGPIRKIVSDVTAVTLNPRVARDGARRTKQLAYRYEVSREDVLVDIDALWPRGHLDEEELLVRPAGLERKEELQTTRRNPPVRVSDFDKEYGEHYEEEATLSDEHRSTFGFPQRPTGALWRKQKVVRFSDLPKLGLNPVNEYNTPTAIYWYPWHSIDSFATERRYSFEAVLEGWTIDLAHIEQEHLDELLGRLGLTEEEVYDESWEWLEDFDEDDSLQIPALWWAATRLAAKRLTEEAERKKRRTARGGGGSYLPPKIQDAWMKVLRGLTDIVYDPGFGIIHEDEPAQLLNFEPRFVKSLQINDRGA